MSDIHVFEKVDIAIHPYKSPSLSIPILKFFYSKHTMYLKVVMYKAGKCLIEIFYAGCCFLFYEILKIFQGNGRKLCTV